MERAGGKERVGAFELLYWICVKKGAEGKGESDGNCETGDERSIALIILQSNPLPF